MLEQLSDGNFDGKDSNAEAKSKRTEKSRGAKERPVLLRSAVSNPQTLRVRKGNGGLKSGIGLDEEEKNPVFPKVSRGYRGSSIERGTGQ